jgi:hypothetical protein
MSEPVSIHSVYRGCRIVLVGDCFADVYWPGVHRRIHRATPHLVEALAAGSGESRIWKAKAWIDAVSPKQRRARPSPRPPWLSALARKQPPKK